MKIIHSKICGLSRETRTVCLEMHNRPSICYPNVFFFAGSRGSGTYPREHWVRGGVHTLMYILIHLDAVLPVSHAASGQLWYCNKKIPCTPKNIFPIDHHYKTVVSKTFEMTPQTVNMVNYYSFNN